MKVKWVRHNHGSEDRPGMRCRLVATELWYCSRLDGLFAGPPSLIVVKLLLSAAAEKDVAIMLLDVKCVFLYERCATASA